MTLGAFAVGSARVIAQTVPPQTPIFEELHSFGSPSTGGGPSAGLIVGIDGAYYGTTETGQVSGRGTVFKVQPNGSAFTVLHRFAGQASSGTHPTGRLLQASDGLLYGACRQGVTNNNGTLFKLRPDGSGFSVIHYFANSLGITEPTGGMIEGRDGFIYGTTRSGGIPAHTAPGGQGTLFRVDRDGTGFTVIHQFTTEPGGGIGPNGDLVQGPDGTIYGTTYRGGGTNLGAVYRINPDGTGFEVMYTFLANSGVGGNPTGGLGWGPDGFLYGTTTTGIFKINPSNSSFAPVFQTYSDSSVGTYLSGPLVFGSDDRLYGAALLGGQFATASGSVAGGTIFRLNRNGTGFMVIKHLDDSATGGRPNGGLIFGADGTLYGTAGIGGAIDGGGTIFKLNPDGTGFQVIKNLSLSADLTNGGGFPLSGVMQGTDGMLYGTNQFGGNDRYAGTVYKMNLDGSGFAVLHNFNPYTTGGFTDSTPIQGSDGLLYGTTPSGYGVFGAGSLYRIAMNGSGFINLHVWDYGTGGREPRGKLVQGTDGVLYGTTKFGGNRFAGTVYKINANGTGHTVLHHFDPYVIAGAAPEAGLTLRNDGVLYGTTPVWSEDFHNETGATIFSLNTYGNGFRIVHAFDITTGINPKSGVILGPDNDLYGAGGSVFRVQQNGLNYRVLSAFSDTGSGSINSGVIQGIDNLLYGVAQGGGLNGNGFLFSMRPDGEEFEVKHHFSGNVDSSSYSKSSLLQASDGNLYGTLMFDGASGGGSVYRLIIGDMRISTLSPRTMAGGSEGFTMTVGGFYFAEGAVIEWDGQPLPTQVVDGFTLTAEVPPTPETVDLSTVQVRVRLADGTVSAPELFVVTAGNVAEADGTLVEPGLSVSVSTAPVDAGSVGVSATLSNTGGEPATLTVANYSSDPSGTVFNAGGGFTDVQITGADLADTATVNFYYPSTIDPATEEILSLVTYDGTGWVTVRSNGDTTPLKNTGDNLDGTVSGGRFTVVFGATSTPKITELGGTFFAMGTPYGFDGFLAPIGGADHESGGSFADPQRTFKSGSTIPVKFRASDTGSPILNGVHTLRARKFSSRSTSDAPIDAKPQGKASTGNRFRLQGDEWHFNLDTKATGMTIGIWKLTATLADGSQHFVWIQIK